MRMGPEVRAADGGLEDGTTVALKVGGDGVAVAVVDLRV